MQLAAALFGLVLASTPAAAGPGADRVIWVGWTDDLFVKAQKEHRLVLLDLEAVWCHWCHVMDEETYSDPGVIKEISEHFIAVKVDQDSRPDLANRYEDYGWPATILFAPDGKELAKRSGYIAKGPFLTTLKAFVADPHPGPSVATEATPTFNEHPALDPALKKILLASHDDLYDEKATGWATALKYLEWRSTEFAMTRAFAGDQKEAARARATLAKERLLVDPVWGGVYQYSEGGVWTKPHYEKIMQYQAEILRVFALAYSQWHDPADIQAAESIFNFVKTFLTSPDGAFFTSMDADAKQGEHSAGYFAQGDAGRRRRGLPRIDTSSYARENGWMIQALCQLYAASGNAEALAAAEKAAAWILKNRALPGGGFRHGDRDSSGPYLGDTLAMGRAFLGLHAATAKRAYLDQAEKAAAFIAANFAPVPGSAGYLTAKTTPGMTYPPKPTRDENLDLARFANLLYNYTAEKSHKQLADDALRYFSTKAIAERLPTGGVLLAEGELGQEPTHVTIVGPKTDEAAKALYAEALKYPLAYRRLEWFDATEGPLRRTDVNYPTLKVAAAFVCTGVRCSVPITKPTELLTKIAKLTTTPSPK